MDPDRGDGLAPRLLPDEGESPLVLNRLDGQAPHVRPAAPVPSPRGGARGGDHLGGDAELGGRHGGHGGDLCTKENLPPLAEHEVEVIIKDALNYQAGQQARSVSRTVGNFRFRILVFPSGTHSTGGLQVSAFVEADPIDGLDPRWVFHQVKYQVTLINWLDYRRSVTKMDTWNFSKEGIDRGWHDMVKTGELSLETGWLGPENSLCFRASCYVRQADSINVSNDYNCRKETGFIGLKNHGATCYMNGLLQSLFHIGHFRRIVYSIDCDEPVADGAGKKGDPEDFAKVSGEDGEGSAPPLIQALQNVFYKLQTSDQAVNCRELMKSFGWDTMDAFTQHDAQELNRILCDRLEEQMKGTPMDGSIKRLFEGEMENYIECIDVDYKSKRNETFYDIQLNIKGESGQFAKDIEESLKDFTAEETLEGDNAYEAEGHGKQRAKKGIRFLTFPPVLNLQLKRFHFDLEKMDMVKLNNRFEFSRVLDLSSFAPGAGTYLLYAVVVHSGDVNSGHYYAHIRHNIDQEWYKFDDDTVTPCSEFAAVEDNYGGSDLSIWNYFDRTPREFRGVPMPTRMRIHNAYMLVYIREDKASQILAPPDPRVTNPKMVDRCEREVRLAEQRRREKMEQPQKIKIKLVFEMNLLKMKGFWDHADIPHELNLKMGRDQLVADLATEIINSYKPSLPRAHMALFSLAYRHNPRQVRFTLMSQNSTFKSHIPQFNAPHFDTADPYLVVLVVASRGYELNTLEWKPSKEDIKPDELSRWQDETMILLVVKYFCVQTRTIVTLGCYYAPTTDPLIAMVNDGWVSERLKPLIASKAVATPPGSSAEEVAGAPAGHTWECWEEFSESDIQPRNVKRSVKNEQLWSGDIIIWQLTPNSPGDATATADAGAGAAPEAMSAPLTPGAEGEDEVAPTYPVNNVADMAAHIANSMEVTVTLHDARQPLCTDGIISNGVWAPPRPQSAAQRDSKKDASPKDDEKPEDAALSLSPAQFKAPQETELEMDLRWHLQHVTGTIARAFELGGAGGAKPSEAQLWLFHQAPSSTCEEPLNAQTLRNGQLPLKELQRTSSYLSSSGKRPLTLHAVELPAQLAQAVDRGLSPICVRFYDDAVREVGSQIVFVPNTGTVAELLTEAKKHIQAEWGLNGALRVMEVVDSRLHKIYRPESQIRSLACFSKANIFYNCVRIEADPEGDSLAEGTKLMEIFHCDRQSQQAFAQPLLLSVGLGEKSGNVKARCKAKLQVPDSEFKSWRLVRSSRMGKTHLKDDEPWDSDLPADAKLCLEHVHPNPTNSLARQSRYNKPLTIKA